MTATLYDVLGVGRDATDAELKAAWRRVAKSTHPDAGGSEAAFQQAEQAWHTLSDPWLRSEYDRSLNEPEPVADPWVAEPADPWIADEPAEQWAAEPAPTGWDASLDDMPKNWLHVHTLRRRIAANVAAVLVAVLLILATLHAAELYVTSHEQAGMAFAGGLLLRLAIGFVAAAIVAPTVRYIIRRRGERW